MSHHAYRRWFGLLFGALTGLIYGLVSQTLNRFILPGIPLYQPPLGMFGNLFLYTLVGAVLGLVDAWPEVSARGVIYSSLLTTLLACVTILFSGQTEAGGWGIKIAAVIGIFIPVIGFLAPFLVAFRWAISREENVFREKRAGFNMPVLQRILLPLALILFMVWVGTASLLNNTAKTALPRMHTLIQQGQAAVSASAQIPAPLQAKNVTMFTQRGQGSYTLQWDRDDTNRYAIPRPPGSNPSTVIAHFDNGYLLVCVFAGEDNPPECRDF